MAAIIGLLFGLVLALVAILGAIIMAGVLGDMLNALRGQRDKPPPEDDENWPGYTP